ncbi:transmembrane protein 174 [Megalobrama amblycephala]|uniref:transmembrane protein 174 n=1 Tax=Megalobrama amblycephala TaxID=75352 RepID=UPI002013F425|nr:transmembrane protein 174 [Megalobrama amblycephala]
MRHYSILGLWKNVTESRNQGTNPLAGPSDAVPAGVCNTISNSNQSPSVAPVNVASLMPSQAPTSSDRQVSDGDKAGATLLFSGVCLGLVGMTFTAMGWTNYNVSHSYEWTQLLGPILLSVGGTFVLISICKFRMLSCLGCKQIDVEGTPEMDPLPPLSGPSFVFTRLNQPITFHRATVVQYIPPPYTSVVPDQSLGPVNGFHSSHQPLAVTVSTPPQYYSVYPMENPSFVSGEDDNTTAEQRENRNHSVSEEDEEGKASTAESASSPPAYEELFATSSCDSYS